MATLKPADFSAELPQAFYLLDARADMEALADATLVVQGKRLPVHSQVLSMQSGVLRGLFAEFLGGTGSGLHVGCKRPADSQQAVMVLEAPFDRCSLFEAALFLRFCYHTHDTASENLAVVQQSLPGLLRLAHKLDAPRILRAVSDCMTGCVKAATSAELAEWVAAADVCQLDSLSLRCTIQLARRLLRGPDTLAETMAEVSCLHSCEKGTLLQLLSLVAAAGGVRNEPFILASSEAAEAAEAAMKAAANLGSFEWALDAFSQQPAGIGQVVVSPYFPAGGRDWRLKVYPGGKSTEAAEHLSVYMEAKHAVQAKYRFAVVNQGTEETKLISGSDAKQFGAACSGWGLGKFMPLAELRSKPGYLAGDRLVLRVRVEVVA